MCTVFIIISIGPCKAIQHTLLNVFSWLNVVWCELQGTSPECSGVTHGVNGCSSKYPFTASVLAISSPGEAFEKRFKVTALELCPKPKNRFIQLALRFLGLFCFVFRKIYGLHIKMLNFR